MGRILIGIIAGAATAFLVIWLIEQVGVRSVAVAPAIDPAMLADVVAGSTAVSAVPLGGRLAIVLGWCLGTLAGGAAAARIAHRRVACWIVAGFVVAGAARTATGIAHPGAMIAAGLVLPWLCAWAVQPVARW